jgi:nitrogen fixation protein FixH
MILALSQSAALNIAASTTRKWSETSTSLPETAQHAISTQALRKQARAPVKDRQEVATDAKAIHTSCFGSAHACSSTSI